MSKILKIGIINVVLISLIIYFFNFMIFWGDYRFRLGKYADFKLISEFYQIFMNRDISDKATYYELIEDKDGFRRIENPLSKKNPIILFSCSFTYGNGLEDNETFSYMLGKLTGRPIYNRSKGGWGVQHMYYQLQNKDFYKIFINSNSQLTSAHKQTSVSNANYPNVDYIIYTFIYSHFSRIRTPVCIMYPRCYDVFYKYTKNKKFKLKKNNFFNSKLVIFHQFMNYLYSKFINPEILYEEEFINYLKECKQYQEAKFPNAKFVIFLYDLPGNINIILKDLGFIIITQKDLGINPEELGKFQLPCGHPNKLYWEIVTPRIITLLNIQ